MLSRRQFLQAAGVAVAARALPRLPSAVPTFEAVYGRALDTLPIYAAPHAAATLVTRLWSDAIAPIIGTEEGWYRLPQGFAPRASIQPMIAPARNSPTPATPPFWAEVSGAVAIVRESCAADAPLIARIGHGGVLRVTDYLPGDGIDWYGVAEDDSGERLGWTQTAAWSPAEPNAALPALSLVVSTQEQRLMVRDGDRRLLTAPISTGQALEPGSYPVTQRQPTATQDSYFGTPWSLTFGDNLYLSGAYWHNHFGAATPGAALQVVPPLAKWLYPRAATVIIS